MKKLNKKGFTLVELLAVIVIMALLVAVAIPAVTRYLETARKGTYYDNVQAAVGAVRNDITASIVSKSNSIYYIGATSGTQPTFTTGCFSIDKTTDTKGNVTQKITQNKTYNDKTSCLAAATADAPLYWTDGWINNLLEKKLLNSAYGNQYSATSYIQVMKTTTNGVTNYTYNVCFIDLDGYGYCGDEAALTNSESITATAKYTPPKK